MDRQSDAAVDGNTVYIQNSDTSNLYAYDTESEAWSQLPDCVTKNCPIAIINGWLTTLGGCSHYGNSNELFSLTGKDSGKSSAWMKKFPPMPTKRSLMATLTTGATLIVTGGLGVSGVLSTVEVMNTETFQWSTAADLPQP